MKRKIFKIVGAGVVIFTLIANLQYALFDYGFNGHASNYQAIARTSSGSNGESVCTYYCKSSPMLGCRITDTGGTYTCWGYEPKS